MKYKGYIADIHYSKDDKLFYGRISNIDDLVNFHSKTIKDIKKEFYNAVDDYLNFKIETSKNYLNLFRKSYFYPIKYISNLPKNISLLFRTIKWSIQRITKGYCDADLWSLYSYYLNIFYNTLKDFSKNLHGAPCEFFDEENDSVEPWVNYLTKMYQCFYNANEENEVYKNEYWDEEYNNLLEYGFNNKINTLNNKNWFKRENEICNLRNEDLRTGLDMMKNVFFNLWD